MGKQSKAEKAIRAVRKQLDIGDYISAVKEVRKRYPEEGLRAAKDFADWVSGNDGEKATDLARTWCEECWDTFPCEHGRRPAPAMTAGMAAPAVCRNERAPLSPEEPLGTADCAEPPLPTREKLKAACKCGDPACTDAWHYAAMWVGLPGNYAKLQAFLCGEKVEGVPFQWRKA